MNPIQIEIANTNDNSENISIAKKIAFSILTFGFLFLLIALTGFSKYHPILLLILSYGFILSGSILYFTFQFKESPENLKNSKTFLHTLSSRKNPAWILGILLTGFYIILYWFPELIQNWIRMLDPLSHVLRNKPADRWFLYGSFYTSAILIMGVRMLFKYQHNKYHVIRTFSVMFFQLGFAFLIPAFLQKLNQPEYYFTYFWPLKYNYLFPSHISTLTSNFSALGYFMVFWGAAMTFIATPILTYFFGKRWYCSWVCGCGGLAETAGDPFRHLSNKSLKAWKFERWSIHSVLVFVVLTTLLLWINSVVHGSLLGSISGSFASVYGFLIGAIFSGVIGVGFYPILGNRVWCRFGCPMAAILGMQQKFFSRFRITTNGGQCISCGNCSTYCEMGIDVKWYAQRGQNIIRSSCVGCGICAEVCPRGVLKIENLPREGRYNIKA